MPWQHYKLAFRLFSPLHIGYRKVSNVQQTRGYVPGKVLWAALTARLTREGIPQANGDDYKVVGEKVNEQFRFSYLFPALDPAGPAACPWEKDFDYRFLSSYASTALNYEQQTAEPGLLHEVEFIRPYARSLNGEAASPVYLVGDLYVQDTLDEKLSRWPEVLSRFQLGGERGYGWGRVRLIACQSQEISEQLPRMTLPDKARIPAHARATGNKAVTGVSGPIEPLHGWERDNTHHERNWCISQAIICYAPGAAVNTEVTFTIGANGLLEMKNG